MTALFYILLLIVGFLCLIKGADFFVDGSAALAKNFKVPGVIVGLTVVAMGTSAPELAVSTSAALMGSNEIAISNVIGSNIFNILMVLGICAFLHPVPMDEVILKRDTPISIGVIILILTMSGYKVFLDPSLFKSDMLDNVGMISRICGIILLVSFA
ncbi:MAG: sodium:calcium antiporter, partial [Lachnospiraceae bacterium]|nr:sodium:calcium antiporter [Lachnospiraceae bacterium]